MAADQATDKDDDDKSKLLICLWTVPRSCSTAFERSFMNRSDIESVFHEPLSIPYYFGPKHERGSTRYSDSEQERESYAEKLEQMKSKKKDGHVFSKDMAYYLKKNEYGQVDQALLQKVVDDFDVHTFLIRNPIKTVKSLLRMSTAPNGDSNNDLTGWSNFDPTEVGFAELKVLRDAVKKKQKGKEPVIVDADELLANPKEVLEGFCDSIGLPFEEERMLHWESNSQEIQKKWADWKGWHEDAIKSTGFSKVLAREHSFDMPLEATQAIDKAVADVAPIYEELYQARLQV